MWIQGGGYSTNSNANYNGTNVVQKSGNNVIFVNFNYRVGVFGFLGGEAVREDGDLNAGLLDQRYLLQWVQKHIHKVRLSPYPLSFYRGPFDLHARRGGSLAVIQTMSSSMARPQAAAP